MGLDTSHNCWHGAYSAFSRWRNKLAEVAGLPPLGLMEGFYKPGSLRPHAGTVPFTVEQAEATLPIKWDCLKPDALHVLLHHSDCDGEIEWKDCGPIADSMERLISLLPDEDSGGHIGNWREKTQQFINGLRAAFAAQENVEFH